VIRRSIENSLAFGAYEGEAQVGFARVLTDYATFRVAVRRVCGSGASRTGVGKLLVSSVVEHPALRELPFMVLATRDAQGLYEAYGDFHVIERPASWMVRRAVPPSQDGLRSARRVTTSGERKERAAAPLSP